MRKAGAVVRLICLRFPEGADLLPSPCSVPQSRGQQTFSGKRQIVNILDFVGRVVPSDSDSALHLQPREAIDNT